MDGKNHLRKFNIPPPSASSSFPREEERKGTKVLYENSAGSLMVKRYWCPHPH
jgi:hypothetical protein